MDEQLLQNAVTLNAAARAVGDELVVDVNIVNDKTGHRVPTDSPLRHLILLVRASDDEGSVLSQVDGPRVPEWAGIGDPNEGYYAGLPGKGYARILEELWTGVSPTGAYWNPTRELSDNRLAAFAQDNSTYRFTMSSEGGAQVEVTLLFRRAFVALMDQKGWDAPDIVMARQQLLIDP
jgi:hypothetical protein